MKRCKCIYFFVALFFIFAGCLLPAQQADAATKIKLNVKKIAITKGDSYTLRVYNTKKNSTISFRSSDSSIIRVGSKSKTAKSVKITGKKYGKATITATVKSGSKTVFKKKCTVNCVPPAATIIFRKKKLSLNVRQTVTTYVSIKPNTSGEVPTYFSKDEDIATVNYKGRIKGIHPGETTIVARLKNGKYAYCKVTVYPRRPIAEFASVNQTRPQQKEKEAH